MHTVRMNVGSVSVFTRSFGRRAYKVLHLAQRYAGTRFRSLVDESAAATDIDPAGEGAFTCPFGKLQIWIPQATN